MKNLICTILFLTSSIAFAQTFENLLLKSTLNRQSENFILPKDPQKRIEYFKTKFLKNLDLNEKTDVYLNAESLETYSHNYEKNQKIRSILVNKILKSTQTDTTLMDSVFIFSFASLNDSTLKAKVFFTYDSGSNLETLLRQELDSITQLFKNTTKEEYFFDQNNRDTLYISYVWNNELKNWMNETKYVTVFDEKGNRILSANYQWQNLSKQWIGWYKFQYEFDKNGNKTFDAYYTWSEINNTWQGYNKSEYQYDENNNLTMSAYYQWDVYTNNWVGSNKNEFEYDNNGNQNSMVSSIWDEKKKDWKYQSKWKSHYENNGTSFSSSSENYTWNEHSEKWIGIYKYVYFNNGQNETTTINYVWSNVNDIWESSEKIVSNWDVIERKNKSIHYLAMDSIIPGVLINGFNSLADLGKIMVNPSCPDQTCTTLDSDVTEGDSAIFWNYNIAGSFNADSGFCQIQLENSIDLSDNTGLSLDYKVIEPSDAIFIIMLTEASGEVWKFQSTDNFNEVTTEWQSIMIPYTDFFQKINYVNGYLNTESIVKIEFRLFAPANIKITGSLLLDNFSAYNIKKTDSWIPNYVDEQILDENGILISGTSSRWDSLSQEFIPYYKYKNDFIYNENGQILQSQLTYWKEFNENWTNETKQLNEYDEYGNLTKSESYYWDASISNWVGTWKSETNWDEFGNTILSVNYQWNFESQDWLPNYKAENKYDASGRQLMYSSYNWNNELKRWIGNYKNETILNDNLEKIRTINYEWNFSENDWKVSYSYVHTESNEMYNEEGLLISISYTAWDENLKVWSPTEKYYIYYSSQSISTKIETFTNFENEMLEVYPNPASELINIRFRNEVYFGNYSLFNSLGQLQKNDIITDKITTLQVDNLPQGIYYLIIDTNNTKISKKIIIRY